MADPGEVERIKAEEIEKQSGKHGSAPTQPHKPPQTEEEKEKKKSWIGVRVVDVEDQPVPGVAYRITLPDDSVAEGTTDDKGRARVEGFEPGNCKIEFPKLDHDCWRPK